MTRTLRTASAQALLIVAVLAAAFLLTLIDQRAPSAQAACTWGYVGSFPIPYTDWGYGACGEPDCYVASDDYAGTCYSQESNYSCGIYAYTCFDDTCPSNMIMTAHGCRSMTCDDDPTLDGCPCTKANACNSTSGSYSGGSCNAAEPAPCCVWNTGDACNVNACGVAGGTVQCNGTCSGAAPAAVDQCPGDAGLQCSSGDCTVCTPSGACAANTCSGSTCSDSCGNVYAGTKTDGYCATCTVSGACAASTCVGNTCSDSCGNVYAGTQTGGSCSVCTPDASCAASTCSGSTCSDSCGNVYAGTKTDGACDAGGGVTPSVSCSPSSQTVASGGSATFTASSADGAGTSYAWLDGSNNVLGSGSPFSRVFTSSGSVRVRASDGGGGYVYSGYCSVTVAGGACSNAGPVSITATPARIQPGSNVTISWTGSNVGAASCTVTNLSTGATVGNSTVTSCSVSGSASISNIQAQTTYRLTCGSLTKDVTVNLVPNLSEF